MKHKTLIIAASVALTGLSQAATLTTTNLATAPENATSAGNKGVGLSSSELVYTVETDGDSSVDIDTWTSSSAFASDDNIFLYDTAAYWRGWWFSFFTP